VSQHPPGPPSLALLLFTPVMHVKNLFFRCEWVSVVAAGNSGGAPPGCEHGHGVEQLA
jgi:hypothetical protein